MKTVADLARALDGIAPFDTQLDWDNSGLLVGDPRREVTKVLVALDATPEVICMAQRAGAQAVVSHHPVIFHPVKRLLAGEPAYEAAARGIAVVSVHTCYDMAPHGVNDALARALGMEDCVPLWEERPGDPTGRSLGLAGALPGPMSPREFAEHIEKSLALPAGFVRYRLSLGPDAPKVVRRAAVCGGAGADYLEHARALGCEAYVTGDVRHHEFLQAAAMGLLLLDAGHFATEDVSMPRLRDQLAAALPGVEVALAADTKA